MPEVIELTKGSRLVVAQEPNPMNPRVPGDVICGTYTPAWNSVWSQRVDAPIPLYDFPGRIVDAVDQLVDKVDDADAAIERWGWLNFEHVIQRHGQTYWYCDRNTFDHLHGGPFDRENQASVIESEVREYEAYLRGDARVVTFQRLAQFRRVTRKFHEKQDDLLEVWENVDYVGDVYFDPSYDAVEVAYEHFFSAMTRKEQTILTAMIDLHMAERALPPE